MSDPHIATNETAISMASNKVADQSVCNPENEHLGSIRNVMANKPAGQVANLRTDPAFSVTASTRFGADRAMLPST